MVKLSLAAAAALVLGSTLPLLASVPVGVDGSFGPEWTGVTPHDIPYSPTGVGVDYSVYTRADSGYVYTLVIANPAGEGNDNWTPTIAAQLGNVVNIGYDLNPSAGNGSDVVVETENNRYTAFPTDPLQPFYNDYSALNGIVQASTSVRGYDDPDPGFSVEIAIPWSFFENDPDGTGSMPVLTASNTDVVVRYTQAFDGTFATQGTQFGNPEPRFGVFTDPNFASSVPEPASLSLLSLAVLPLLSRKRRRV